MACTAPLIGLLIDEKIAIFPGFAREVHQTGWIIY